MEVLAPGSQVDQFRIVRTLGKGGMSEVYLARDTTLGRKVALKIIRAEFAESPRRLELFLHEAHLTAKFAHPHIITIYTVGKYDGHPYLALEYLEGQTLGTRMSEGAMSVRETIRIGLAIAQALEEAHSHGVLHRDLKPANVIIPPDGRLRVLDFGIAKIVEDSIHSPTGAKELSSEITREETQLGEVKGTPKYMAPERWLGDVVTGAADVWALGVILYTMLAQVHPFAGKARQMQAIAKRIVSTLEPPNLPQDLEVPAELAQMITSMLDKMASRRPTAGLIVEVFQGLLQRKAGQILEKTNPFRGLLPFSERHADLFFGRSAEIEMAVEKLRHEPVLPVVGPSGAGKSSFVAAGIVPRLRELDRWLVLTVRPGTDPFGTLGSVILFGGRGNEGNTTSPSVAPKFLWQQTHLKSGRNSLESGSPQNRNVNQEKTAPESTESKTKTVPTQKLAHTLREKTLALPSSSQESQLPLENENALEAQSLTPQRVEKTIIEGIAQVLLEHPAKLLLELQTLADETQSKVLLVVDQLEELYTLDHTPDLRRAYMDAVSCAADDPDGPIRVILTLREDFLGRVTNTPAAQKALSRITVLRTLEEEALQEIVTNPVKLAGYSFEDDLLPEQMLDAVHNAPSTLPILQFACSQFWNRRDVERRLLTRAAYEAMGGVEGALAWMADELLAGFVEVQRTVVRQMMLRLVTPEATRKVVTAHELLDGLDSSAAAVLNRLTEARIVVSRRALGKDSTESELELVHDSLIHSWKPLVRWLEQNHEELVFLDEVSRAAELWDSRGCPKEEVWSGEALDEALAKVKRCEVVPNRVKEFLDAGVRQRQVRIQGRRHIRIAIVVTLLLVIAVLAYMNQQTEIQRNRERQARATALREGARAAYTKGDYLEARSKLRVSLEARDSTQARALWWLLENEPLVWSEPLGGYLNQVRISPDGDLIAASSSNGVIHIFNRKTLKRHGLRGHKGQVFGLDFSPSGQWLSSGSSDREIRLWNLEDGTTKVLKGHTNMVLSTAFSPDGKRLISGSRDHTIRIWDVESGRLLRTLKNDANSWSLRFTADGRHFISAHGDEKLRVWDAHTYDLVKNIEENQMRIFDFVTSKNDKFLAYGGRNGFIVVRDLKTHQKIKRISSDTSSITSVRISPNNRYLSTSLRNGKIWVWKIDDLTIINQFQHSNSATNCIAFLPDGKQLVSASFDGEIKLWNILVKSILKGGVGHSGPIFAVAFTHDSKTIMTGGNDGALFFWDVKSGQPLRRIRAHDSSIYSLDVQPGGNLLVSGANDGSIRLWEIPTGRLVKTLNGHTDAVTSAVFSPDGTKLFSASMDNTVIYWDMENLVQMKSFSINGLFTIDIDHEGRLLASSSNQKFIDVRDLKTGNFLQKFSGHKSDVFKVIFSPNGKSIYSSSLDHSVRRYQLDEESTHGMVVAQHIGAIYSIDVISSAGDILGTPSADRTAKIWNLDTKKTIILKGHGNEVNALKFSPDGTLVATVSDDSTVRLWDSKNGRPLWRAPLMLGWTALDANTEPSPSTKQWQIALEARAKIASASADDETLCLVTADDELEIWDIENDERMIKSQQPSIQQVLAVRKGCLTRSDGTLTLTNIFGNAVPLGTKVGTMSRYEDAFIVLQDERVRIFDREGNWQDEFTVTTGASSLTIVGDTVAMGFPDGSIEIWRRLGPLAERDFVCREVEASPVTDLIPGPPDTVIAGFANGTIGIWSLNTGERLFTQRLHGPVIHLLHQNQKLWAATELGSQLQLDLSTFYIEYCELMERVWRSVPWIWKEGRPHFRERPTDHTCARR